jgi:hypothetical protein
MNATVGMSARPRRPSRELPLREALILVKANLQLLGDIPKTSQEAVIQRSLKIIEDVLQ